MHRLPSDVTVRMLADGLMVSFSLLVGLLAQYFAMPLLSALLPLDEGTPGANSIDLQTALAESLRMFIRAAPVLTMVTVGLFFVSGVYTRARFFQASYKVRRLVQSVTAAYALFGLLTPLIGQYLVIPRVALVAAWLLTLVLLVSARFWLSIWNQLVFGEGTRGDGPARPMRTVLVIGGAGYIGSCLCHQLLERGYRVRVLDALFYGGESIRDLTGRPDFELDEGDSRDIASLVRAVWGADAVVHLGEIVGDPACALDEQITLEINLAATRMAAEVAKGFGVQRFVYASSCSVYGASSDIVDERSELNPVSLYARAKIGAERILLGLRGKSFHPVIVRFATAYGLSYRPRFDLVVNALAARAVTDGEITVFGGGQWRPFVHVQDVARALILCLEKPIEAVDGQIFNVGSDAQNHTIHDVARLILAYLPHTQLRLADSGNDPRDYHVSFAKIRNELGFRPRMTVADGIREIVLALRTGNPATYGDPRHDNARFLLTDYGSRRVRAFHAAPLYQPDRSAVSELLGSPVARASPLTVADRVPAESARVPA